MTPLAARVYHKAALQMDHVDLYDDHSPQAAEILVLSSWLIKK